MLVVDAGVRSVEFERLSFLFELDLSCCRGWAASFLSSLVIRPKQKSWCVGNLNKLLNLMI